MRHISTMECLIQTLVNNDLFHALVVQSPPGWSKSTTVGSALRRLGMPFTGVGSYTTPLHFFNTLVENPCSTILLDDSSGLFSDAKGLALLKAATWETSGGSGGPVLPRRVSWGSTSGKALAPSVAFRGKIILLTNVLPQSLEIQAFLSRCLNFQIAFSEAEIRGLILEATSSPDHFDLPALAKEVAEFMVLKIEGLDYSQMNLRTLRMGYELAKTQPDRWREILPLILPRRRVLVAAQVASDLINPNLPPKLQEAEFRSRTGKSRRTFYLYKKRLGLTRHYRSKGKQRGDGAIGA